jgi:hypothetical protein
MSRVLICTLPVPVPVNSGLPIACALVGHGPEAWWYTGQKFRAEIEPIGRPYVPMQAAISGGTGCSGLTGLNSDLTHKPWNVA